MLLLHHLFIELGPSADSVGGQGLVTRAAGTWSGSSSRIDQLVEVADAPGRGRFARRRGRTAGARPPGAPPRRPVTPRLAAGGRGLGDLNRPELVRRGRLLPREHDDELEPRLDLDPPSGAAAADPRPDPCPRRRPGRDLAGAGGAGAGPPGEPAERPHPPGMPGRPTGPHAHARHARPMPTAGAATGDAERGPAAGLPPAPGGPPRPGSRNPPGIIGIPIPAGDPPMTGGGPPARSRPRPRRPAVRHQRVDQAGPDELELFGDGFCRPRLGRVKEDVTDLPADRVVGRPLELLGGESLLLLLGQPAGSGR